jgi:NADH:ubiquinone reductase (H+-translocating)
VFWLAAHLAFFIDFRNRLTALSNWGFSYLTYQRHARVVFAAGKPQPQALPAPLAALLG